MEQDDLERIKDSLSLERTDKLFDSAVIRGDSHGKSIYTEEDVKKQRVVVAFGNLHLNTARAKMSAVRLLGYKKSINETASAVKRKYAPRQEG